jgi:radical SAM protein with 4Fe4S-binding SPASM domain
MKAKDLTGKAPGGKRKKLTDILPLKTPLIIEYYPIYACNFKCNYCLFSLPKNKRHFISNVTVMDLNLFKKSIDDIKEFPEKVKMLRFGGIGEPLMHNNISEMVKYAYENQVAETIEIISNGSLLNKSLSDKLINAGLTRLIISVQGVSGEKYKKVSDVDLNFNSFIKNIEYFYKNKINTHLYIKIADVALDNVQEEKTFFELFGDICDSIAVEHIVPIQQHIDYKGIIREDNLDITQFGQNAIDVKICPQPFFTLRINTDGKILPCYSFEFPCFVGDCNLNSVTKIWESKEYNNFRLKMLHGRETVSEICKKCKIIKHRIFQEDIIEQKDADRLRIYYSV